MESKNSQKVRSESRNTVSFLQTQSGSGNAVSWSKHPTFLADAKIPMLEQLPGVGPTWRSESAAEPCWLRGNKRDLEKSVDGAAEPGPTSARNSKSPKKVVKASKGAFILFDLGF